jgi:hypothetical protein
VRRVRASFCILACAEPPTSSSQWLTDETLALFAYVPLPQLTPSEQHQLVAAHRPPPAAQPALTALLAYERAVRVASDSEPSLRVAQPSNRQLLRAARHLCARPTDTVGALRRASAAAMLAMPPAARATALALLRDAASKAGLPAAHVNAIASTTGADDTDDTASGGGGGGGGQAARLVAEAKAQAEAEEKARKARDLKALEQQAISLRFGSNPYVEAQARPRCTRPHLASLASRLLPSHISPLSPLSPRVSRRTSATAHLPPHICHRTPATARHYSHRTSAPPIVALLPSRCVHESA